MGVTLVFKWQRPQADAYVAVTRIPLATRSPTHGQRSSEPANSCKTAGHGSINQSL
jgi:hypothetical protein